ncbi:MAG: Uma2 family endonuclease [Chloracidobacterium sp.]|nr:Uma2 family endonuclease [Chloracidobacterium sp.]MDW8217509.1 Uma2 family endonuclease [Acidobacteriota bacterium]
MSLSYILQELDDPDFSDIQVEDETGGFAADKTLRLLVSTLYTSWRPAQGATFLAAVRVAIVDSRHRPTTVTPDLFLAQAIIPADEWWKPTRRLYDLSYFGKPPELVLDLVTRLGQPEAQAARHQTYEQLGVTYRVVYDPCRLCSDQAVTVFERQGDRLTARTDAKLPQLGLGLALQRGVFEGRDDTWLRWIDADGKPLLTGDELADFWRRQATAAAAACQAPSGNA